MHVKDEIKLCQIFCALQNWTYVFTQRIRQEINRVYDKIYAAVYGHCVGDALGLLTETLTKDDAKRVWSFTDPYICIVRVCSLEKPLKMMNCIEKPL